VILALAAWGLASCDCSSLSHIILVLRVNHHSHRRTIFCPPSQPLFTTMCMPKPPPSLEDQTASMAAQMEKLAAAVTATQGDSAKIIQIADSLATLQGNQGQLIVAVNWLQFEKIVMIFQIQGTTKVGKSFSPLSTCPAILLNGMCCSNEITTSHPGRTMSNSSTSDSGHRSVATPSGS
jgi:hypothetical protein